MRKLFVSGFLGSMLFIAASCGSSKKPASGTALVSANAQLQSMIEEANRMKVANLGVQTDTVKKNKSVQTIAKDPTQEEQLQIQKQTGLFKDADFTPAMHYDLRRPNYVIIHHTAQNSIAQTIRTFQVPHSKVSAHYVIGRDGRIVQMLNDYDRAWHAGKSKWGSLTDINSSSIGIELDNNGRDSFPDAQIKALLVLLDTLKSKYYIPQLNFIGHADIAPSRKDDPNITFPWKKLADRGFGIWYNEDNLVTPPSNFNPIDALKIMGYDMRNQDSAIQAFKRKYIVKEVNGKLTDYDKKVLYDLYTRYY